MNRIHRIALRGMKGRKKDTAVLVIVIVMSFLFLTVGTLLLSSLTESQRQQRIGLYGSWKLSDNRQNPTVSQRLAEQSWIIGAHQVEILGSDRACGSVSVWDDDFARMGGLQLIEGRAPEAPGEIVLEKGQLSLFGEETGVGSKVRLELSYEGTTGGELRDPERPQTMELFDVTVDAEPFYEVFAQDINPQSIEGGISEFVCRFDELSAEFEQYGFDLSNFPAELPDTIEEMRPEQIRQLLDCLAEQPYLLADLTGSVNKPINVRELGRVYYPGGKIGDVDWSMQSTYTLRTAAPHLSHERIMQYGALTEQSLTLTRECTVVGILETTADRWDVTDLTVPNSYISAPTRQELQETVDQLVQRDRPEQFSAEPETVLPRESYMLYETADSMADTYEKLQAIPGNLLEQEPVEVLIDLDVPLSGERLTEEQLVQDAQEALSGTAYTLEDVNQLWQNESFLYGVSFASEDQTPTEAYFVVPGMQAVMSDGSSHRLRAPSGELIYRSADRWDTCHVDTHTMEYTDFAPEGYRSLGYLHGTLADVYACNTQMIGINRYAYPAEQGLTATMGGTLVAVIVIITVCAVFQIFFTQLRRRTRKLTLLRSIGATNGQIFAMLGFEGLYITLAGVLLGDGIGLLLARLIVYNLKDTFFHTDWKLFLTGQLWGIAAVAAGMMLPSVRAIRAPLVGRMTGKRRRHVKIKPMKRQNFSRICIRDLKSNPGRTLGTAALCIFLVAMELCCVFLGNAAFDTYRETILSADKPDFTLTMNHAGSRRKVEPMLEALGEMEGLERCDFYRSGRGLFLWYDGMENSPVVRAVAETDSRFYAPTKSLAPKRDDPALVTEFYGINSDTELFARISDAITEGSIDPAAYDAGEEVIVLLPMYAEKDGGLKPGGATMAEALRSAGRMEFSFRPETAGAWSRDTSLSPGSAVTLGTDHNSLKESGSGYQQTLLQTKVGAIVRYFPEEGIWPFSGEPQSHVVIGSRLAMAKLYSEGFTTYDSEQMQYLDMRIEYFMPTEYGNGIWNLYAKEGADVETTLSPLSRFARQEHLTLRSFMDSKRTVYEKALSSAILVGTMAMAATVIVWMILFNTLQAAQEQGRARTGILQALGVSKRQFYQAQAVQALGYWAVTAAVSNLLLLLLVLISGAAEQAGQQIGLAAILQMALQDGFQGYPWWLHGSLCLLQLPVLLVFFLHAAKIPMRYSPIDNIRS